MRSPRTSGWDPFHTRRDDRSDPTEAVLKPPTHVALVYGKLNPSFTPPATYRVQPEG